MEPIEPIIPRIDPQVLAVEQEARNIEFEAIKLEWESGFVPLYDQTLWEFRRSMVAAQEQCAALARELPRCEDPALYEQRLKLIEEMRVEIAAVEQKMRELSAPPPRTGKTG